MPKVKRTARIRSNAATKGNASSHESTTPPPTTTTQTDGTTKAKPPILSRGQKKRQAKREQYLKREQLIFSTLQVKRLEEQKGRLDGLDALKEALTNSMTSTKKADGESNAPNARTKEEEGPALKSNKSRKSLVQKELPHFNLVLQHPVFKKDPFATMQEHLKNSFAKQAEEQAELAKQEREEESKKVLEKKEARKERIRNSKYQKGRRNRKVQR